MIPVNNPMEFDCHQKIHIPLLIVLSAALRIKDAKTYQNPVLFRIYH
jgi:hypothetical protein